MKIIIAIATRSNDIYYKQMAFVAEQYRKYNQNGNTCELIFGECGWSAEYAQQMLIGQLVNNESFDYCLILDTDVCPPMDALDKLIACQKDIVGAPVWHFVPSLKDVHMNVHYSLPLKIVHTSRAAGVEETIFTSFACLLFSRRVFESIKTMGSHPLRWDDSIGPEWKEMPTDHVLYAKLRNRGFKSYVCWDIRGAVHNRLVSLDDETLNNIKQKVSINV